MKIFPPSRRNINSRHVCLHVSVCWVALETRRESSMNQEHAFHLRNNLCCFKTTCKKKKIKLSNSFMHWVRILLQGVQILGKDDRKATWLCCWANGLTLVKLLTRWKKKIKKKGMCASYTKPWQSSSCGLKSLRHKTGLECSRCKNKADNFLPYVSEQLFQHIALNHSMLKQLSKCFRG